MRGRTFATLYTIVRLCLLLSLTIAPFIAGALNAISEHTVNGHAALRHAFDVALPGVRLALWFGGGDHGVVGARGATPDAAIAAPPTVASGRHRRTRSRGVVGRVGSPVRRGMPSPSSIPAEGVQKRVTLHRRRRRRRASGRARRSSGWLDRLARTLPATRRSTRRASRAARPRVPKLRSSCCTAGAASTPSELELMLEDRRLHVERADPAGRSRTGIDRRVRPVHAVDDRVPGRRARHGRRVRRAPVPGGRRRTSSPTS